MNFTAAFKQSLSAAALLTIGMLAVPSAEAIPFTATVRAGFDAKSLVTVGILDFGAVEGDGSVRKFDYRTALGDGSVRTVGDGSVRTCGDGSVMPAAGQCDGSVVIGDFSLGGSFDTDPFIVFAVGASNFGNKPLLYDFTFAMNFTGGGYNTVATDLIGTGIADSILLEALIDQNVVPGASIACASPALCTDPTVTLASPTGATGELAAHLVFTVPAVTDNLVSMNGSVVLSQVAPPAVPEPATLSLLALGLLAGGRVRRSRAA